MDTDTLADSAVTPAKLNLGGTTNYVVTTQNTTSTTYANLSTVQSISVGTDTTALVLFSAGAFNVAAVKRISVAVSGATTIAPSDDYSIRVDGSTFNASSSMFVLFTSLTPGTNTFTLQFKTASGTASFFERSITVIPL